MNFEIGKKPSAIKTGRILLNLIDKREGWLFVSKILAIIKKGKKIRTLHATLIKINTTIPSGRDLERIYSV